MDPSRESCAPIRQRPASRGHRRRSRRAGAAPVQQTLRVTWIGVGRAAANLRRLPHTGGAPRRTDGAVRGMLELDDSRRRPELIGIPSGRYRTRAAALTRGGPRPPFIGTERGSPCRHGRWHPPATGSRHRFGILGRIPTGRRGSSFPKFFTKCLPTGLKTGGWRRIVHPDVGRAGRADFGRDVNAEDIAALVCLAIDVQPDMTEISPVPEIAAPCGDFVW
jgi:hypothetical protein